MMFAKEFPKSHPRAGQPTRFPERIWSSLEEMGYMLKEPPAGFAFSVNYYRDCPMPKRHTIRAGKRWSVGDKFSPRVWSGKPYRSPTVIFGPVMEVKKTWDIMIDECGVISIDGKYPWMDVEDCDAFFTKLANNDGLTDVDFHHWFPTGQRFEGQIICWNDKIEY